MFTDQGFFESIRHLNAMVFLSRQYDMEIDWEKSAIDGSYLTFKPDRGDVNGFARALNRMFTEQWG